MTRVLIVLPLSSLEEITTARTGRLKLLAGTFLLTLEKNHFRDFLINRLNRAASPHLSALVEDMKLTIRQPALVPHYDATAWYGRSGGCNAPTLLTHCVSAGAVRLQRKVNMR